MAAKIGLRSTGVAFQLRLQHQIGGAVPGQVFLMMAYLLSIAALVIIALFRYRQILRTPYHEGE